MDEEIRQFGDQLGRLPATFELVPRTLLVRGFLQPVGR